MSQLSKKQYASVFDIIGPNMVGPSSSHTAGALRISLLASSLMSEPIKKIYFLLYGSFAHTYQGHGTDKALVGGALGFKSDDLRIRDSFAIAKERNISFSFEPDIHTVPPHPNTVEIFMEGVNGARLNVQGISIGGGQAMITRINSIDLELSGAFETMVVEHWDRPGALMRITIEFNKLGINIASLKLYRENKGERAFAIMETDELIPDSIVQSLQADSTVINTILIHKSDF